MRVVIGLDGYTLKSGFIAKELVILFSNGEFEHYIFNNLPTMLTQDEFRTVRYVTKNLSGLNYRDGMVDYSLLGEIFKRISNFHVYTYGDLCTKVLQSYLPTTLISNVQHMGFTMPSILEDRGCFKKHVKYRYCAKSKAFTINDFVKTLE